MPKLKDLLGPAYDFRDYEPRWHADGFDMPFMPLTTSEAPRLVAPAMWKLIPQWVKTYEEAKKYANTLNAACEEIFEKASYKNYIKRQRALLWVDGFFEPHHSVPKKTIPYYVYMQDGAPFSLGCVYSNWVNQETGEVIVTFSIITTAANDLMSRVHNEKKRMPLIIEPEKRDAWLQANTEQQIRDLMHPLHDGLLAAHPVSNLLYAKGKDTNIPEIIAPCGEVWL